MKQNVYSYIIEKREKEKHQLRCNQTDPQHLSHKTRCINDLNIYHNKSEDSEARTQFNKNHNLKRRFFFTHGIGDIKQQN